MYMCGAEAKRLKIFLLLSVFSLWCLKTVSFVVYKHLSFSCFFFCLQWASLFLCNSLFLILVLLDWGWFFFLFHTYKDAEVHSGIIKQFFGNNFLNWVTRLVCVFFVASSGQNFSRCQCLVRWLVESLLQRARRANDLWAGSSSKQWLHREPLCCGVRLIWSCENGLDDGLMMVVLTGAADLFPPMHEDWYSSTVPMPALHVMQNINMMHMVNTDSTFTSCVWFKSYKLFTLAVEVSLFVPGACKLGASGCGHWWNVVPYPYRTAAGFNPLKCRRYCDSFTHKSVFGLSPGLDYSLVHKK